MTNSKLLLSAAARSCALMAMTKTPAVTKFYIELWRMIIIFFAI